jgi:hypothetical protein
LGYHAAAYSAATAFVGACGLLVSASVQVLCTFHININIEVDMFINAIVTVGLALLGESECFIQREVEFSRPAAVCQE